jgi:hypothetical protein
MNPIIVNKNAAIFDGMLVGVIGRVVGADSELKEVTLEIEKGTYVTVSRDRVYQGEDTHGTSK